jgi:hypothetical protein
MPVAKDLSIVAASCVVALCLALGTWWLVGDGSRVEEFPAASAASNPPLAEREKEAVLELEPALSQTQRDRAPPDPEPAEQLSSVAADAENDEPNAYLAMVARVNELIRPKEEYEAMDFTSLKLERERLTIALHEMIRPFLAEQFELGRSEYLGTAEEKPSPPPERIAGKIFSTLQTGGDNRVYWTVLEPDEYPDLYRLQDTGQMIDSILRTKQPQGWSGIKK